MKDKLYVVEGSHDEALLKHVYPEIKTISVGGSQIKDDVLKFLIEHQGEFEIILILDPDHQGKRIRDKLSSVLKEPKHIFLDKEFSRSKNNRKIGLEHVPIEYLKQIIKYEVKESNVQMLSMHDLYDLKLTGFEESKDLRYKVASHYHLGHVNSKTLLKRLNWLNLTKSDIKRVIDASS
ncbi:ribonuclease M5 [Acholeplasma equifetale]|jgi:ribonuclease M5|uniref:ribonuclease M5 n=1 Tax=Acholeplasma equifetale TaxID=264634 RepID=UPI00047C3E51|nr:ribonuclease M5 [Acholeplasma equifetale]